MAAAKYRGARFAVAALVTAGVVGGTAYFTQSAPAHTSESTVQDQPLTTITTTGPATAPARQVPVYQAPSKRSRGS